MYSSRFNDAYKMLHSLERKKGNQISDDAEFRFLLALSAWNKLPASPETIAEAKQRFEGVIEAYPETEYARLSLYNLARIAELRDYPGDEPDLEQAREGYRKLIQTYPETEYADEATLLLAGSYTVEYDKPEEVRKGVAILEAFVREHPDSPYTAHAHLILGDIYNDILQARTEALQHYIACDEKGIPADDLKVKLYWKIATIAKEFTGQAEIAAEYFYKSTQVSAGRRFEAILELRQLKESHPELEITVPQMEDSEAL